MMPLNTQPHINPFASMMHNYKVQKEPTHQVELANRQSISRKVIENFIQDGFIMAYKAKIRISMPYLLSLKLGDKQASLGFRGGHFPLFVEQYFSQPLEQHAYFTEKYLNREHVAEIGHLYSNAKQLTLPLFMMTALSLKQMGFRYLLFSATEKVTKIIKKTGVELTYLVDAVPEMLIDTTECWGSYYDTNPKVFVLRLDSVVEQIQHAPYFLHTKAQLLAGVNAVYQQFLFQNTYQQLTAATPKQ